MAYTWYKLCIIQFLDLYMISSVKQAPTKSQMNGYTSAHVYQERYHVKVTQRALFTQNVYITVYTWYIPSIYPSFCTSRTRSCPLRRPASLSSLRLGRLAEQLSFGHRKHGFLSARPGLDHECTRSQRQSFVCWRTCEE